MLKKGTTALLISDVPDFSNSYNELANDIGVEMTVCSSWNERYRVKEDVVILGSKHLEELNESYYPKAVILLKSGENPAQYIKRGISRFVFDHNNHYELLVALFYEEPVVVQSTAKEVKDIVRDYGMPLFHNGVYDFRFDTDIYKYKGRPIYLCSSQKKFLAEWLLGGHKDNKRRMILCNLRKKFGAEFLKDVDRFGNIRRHTNE